ncbi:apolipoprotein N-acyltransferase [Myxococcota bacterium]
MLRFLRGAGRRLSRLPQWSNQHRVALALCVASAVLAFVAFCGFDQWYLGWVCLVPVLWALDDESLSGWEALGLAWFFGTVAYVGGYTWIAGMLIDFGHLPWPLATLGMVLLCFAQALLFALWGWGTNRLVCRYGASVVWVAPTLMVLVEWAVPALFPTYLSNSQYRQILFIQTLDVWGPLGLTFILILGSSVLYETLAWRFRGRRKLPVVGWIVFVVLLGGDLLYGAVALSRIDERVAAEKRRIRVGMVQVAMGIYAKDTRREEGHRRHLEQSLEVQKEGVDLIVWPESGFNYAISAETENVANTVLGPITTPVLFGGMRWVSGTRHSENREFYNSAFLVDGDGQIHGTYDKTYLLMFGEYLPFGETFPQLYKLSPHSGRFSRGKHTLSLELDDIRYGVMICYEDIIPRFVRKLMEHEPHVLINITNDAWFGKSREPTIHLALAVYRAVEHRRFLARSTNTGISAFIDPAGRIRKETPVFERANLIDEVVPLTGRTLYSHLGDWLVIPCIAAVLLWLRQPIRRLASRLRGSGSSRKKTK